MIIIPREVTVSGINASLSEPIHLYKGDGDITLLLDVIKAIRTTKFGKITRDNIISDEIVYGAACIYKPDGSLGFVVRAEIVDLKFQATLDKTMMDENTEVGEHTLQIHLFDADNNRLTIPEVGQLFIMEPLCDNLHEPAEVTVAQVDDSAVGYTTVASDDGVEAYAGGYSRYTWTTGEYITASKLNNMMTGIDEALEGGGGTGVDLSNYATKNELSNKVDKVSGKGLSTNDLTNTLKNNYDGAYTHSQSAHFDGNYNNLTNKPTIPTVDVTKSYVDIQIESHTHDEYATENYVVDKINQAQLGGGDSNVDLSAYALKSDLNGYVTKTTGNASQITFSDGQTFQNKLNNGSLKGDKGDKGDTGSQGPQGEKGADGLTTSIKVNGTTYTHQNGVITLPDYPTSGGSGSSSGGNADSVDGLSFWTGTQSQYDAIATKDANTVYLIKEE